jgi:hypothetical protein
MVGSGFHSIANSRALMPRFATKIISPRQTAFQCTADCQRSALRPNTNHAESLRLWQSALKLRLLTLAISSMAIFIVAIRGVHAAFCQHRVKNWSAEFSYRVKSSPRHFTSSNRLFEASHIFDASLYKCKTDTRSIV